IHGCPEGPRNCGSRPDNCRDADCRWAERPRKHGFAAGPFEIPVMPARPSYVPKPRARLCGAKAPKATAISGSGSAAPESPAQIAEAHSARYLAEEEEYHCAKPDQHHQRRKADRKPLIKIGRERGRAEPERRAHSSCCQKDERQAARKLRVRREGALSVEPPAKLARIEPGGNRCSRCNARKAEGHKRQDACCDVDGNRDCRKAERRFRAFPREEAGLEHLDEHEGRKPRRIDDECKRRGFGVGAGESTALEQHTDDFK